MGGGFKDVEHQEGEIDNKGLYDILEVEQNATQE